MPHALHGFNELLAKGWDYEDDRLTKTFAFLSFGDAIGFMVEMSFVVERMNHHPEWTNVYNEIEVELTTHDAGGVTALDITLAQAFDAAYSRKDRLS